MTDLVVGRTNLVVIPGYEDRRAAIVAEQLVERAADAKRKAEWGTPVTKAICAHRPIRLRLWDHRNHELAIAYHVCAECSSPLFPDANGEPVQIYRAEECGCVFGESVCDVHGEGA